MSLDVIKATEKIARKRGCGIETCENTARLFIPSRYFDITVDISPVNYLGMRFVYIVAKFHSGIEYPECTELFCNRFDLEDSIGGKFFVGNQDGNEDFNVLVYINRQLITAGCEIEEVLGDLINLMIAEVDLYGPIVVKTTDGVTSLDEAWDFLLFLYLFPNEPNA